MYYNNSSATSGGNYANNGTNTFEFFDDFENYTDGSLNGQGGWSGDTNFQVQTVTVREGSKAVKFASTAFAVNIAHNITFLPKLKLDAYLNTSSAIGSWDQQITLYEGANKVTGVSLNYYISNLKSGGWENRGTATQNTWYKFGILIDSASTHKLFINDVEDTSIITSNYTNIVTGIDTIKLDCKFR